MPKPRKTAVVRARVPDEVKTRLMHYLATRSGRSESDVVREAILDYLDAHDHLIVKESRPPYGKKNKP